jgi:hypothetical protein
MDFQPCGPEQWGTKRSLVLVCKEWRTLATDILYQDVVFHHQAQGLLETLERSAQSSETSQGYGRWVRRITLRDTNVRIRFLDIFRLCPRVETFIYKPATTKNFDSHFWEGILHAPSGTCTAPPAPLVSLRHLKWNVGIERHAEDEELAQLSELIIHAPNLQNLSLVLPFHRDLRDKLFGPLTCRHPHPPGVVLLPALKMLTVRGGVHSLDQLGPFAADMPNLTYFNLPCQNFSGFFPSFGRQLHTLQLLSCVGFSQPHDIWGDILRECPNLRELSYDVYNTNINARNPDTHASLSLIRLRYYPGRFRVSYQRPQNSPWPHLTVFANAAMLPALKQVVLVRGPVSSDDHERIESCRKLLEERGCRLHYVEDF